DAYAAEDSRTAENILARVFAACDERPSCREDMGGPAAAIYGELASRLAKAPIQVDYPLPNGKTARRDLNHSMLEGAVFTALYKRGGRGDFLRVLAAANRGDFVPLMRLVYSNLALDPETLDGSGYSAFYLGAYYGISCQDYTEPGDDPETLAKSILAEAKI